MLKNEHDQDNPVVTSSQWVEAKLEVDNSWKESILKGSKRSGSKLEPINSKEQITLANRYEVLATESDTYDSRIKMKL
jgi:hypothetical protein